MSNKDKPSESCDKPSESCNISNHDIVELLMKINSRLDKLETKVDKITESTKNMDGHINFVEQTYQTIKTPFHQIMDYVGSYNPLVEYNVERGRIEETD